MKNLVVLNKPDKTILLHIDKEYFIRNIDYTWLLDVEILPILKERDDQSSDNTTRAIQISTEDINDPANASH